MQTVTARSCIMEDGHRITEPIVRTSVARDLGVSEDEVEVKHFEVARGSAKGENYATEMKSFWVEAIVKGAEVKRKYMAKSFPMSEFRVDLLKEVRVHNGNEAMLCALVCLIQLF